MHAETQKANMSIPYVCVTWTLTLHTYWLRAPGEKVCERTMALPRMKGEPCPQRPPRSLGRTLIGSGKTTSVFVALSIYLRHKQLSVSYILELPSPYVLRFKSGSFIKQKQQLLNKTVYNENIRTR